MFQIKKTGLNILLFVSSLIICVSLVIILMRICVSVLGLEVKEIICCLPRPHMWVEDQDIGYRNKPYLKKRVFGNILCETNSRGFRSYQDVFQSKDNESLRIVGIGDSVMWGNKVNLEDTFTGKLQRLLEKKHLKVDVINSGVVGYSTLQEKLFYEKFIKALHRQFLKYC